MKVETFNEKMERFEKLISNLNCEIICGIGVNSLMLNSSLYEPASFGKNGGKFDGKRVVVNENLLYNDLRIFNMQKKELIDLKKHRFFVEEID